MTPVSTASSHANGFLFADLRDYTRFVEAHGDRAAAELLAAYRSIVRAEIERSPGAEIRTEGDSFYVVFPSASTAIRTALAILDAARAASISDPERPLRVGIGVHAGETEETAEGNVGSAVNIAARVCSQAKAGELLVTDTVRGLTRTSLPYAFIPVGERRLKGIAEAVKLYRVAPGGSPMPRPGARARLAGLVSRKRLSVLAGLVVALVVAGLAGAMTLNLAGGPVRTPGASLSAAAVPSATIQPTVVDDAYPNRAEGDLLSRLPTTVYDGGTNCHRETAEASPGASVSIRCDLGIESIASYVIYEQFPGVSDLDKIQASYVNGKRLQQGDCETQEGKYEPWQLPGIWDGELICFQDAGQAWVVWSYAGLSPLMARATRENADWQRLYTWWHETANLLKR